MIVIVKIIRDDHVMLCEIWIYIMAFDNLAHNNLVMWCENFVNLLNEMSIKDMASSSIEIIKKSLICEVTINIFYLLLLKLRLLHPFEHEAMNNVWDIKKINKEQEFMFVFRNKKLTKIESRPHLNCLIWLVWFICLFDILYFNLNINFRKIAYVCSSIYCSTIFCAFHCDTNT